MADVLLIGESWFTYTIHQKGFDSFSTAEYTEDGAAFVGALAARGHRVDRVPAHLVHDRIASGPAGFADYDVVVVSDIGANSFQLAPDTFARSQAVPDKAEALRAFTEAGGGLLMIGGYLSFSGVDAKARWGRCPFADALAVTVLDRDDRVELPEGAEPTITVTDHPVTAGMDPVWPPLLGLNEVRAKAGATVLAACAGHPLLAVAGYGRGRTAAFTSDIAPHWAPRRFLEWPGYAQLWHQTVTWLAGRDT